MRLDLQGHKTISLLNSIDKSLNIQIKISVFCSELETTNLESIEKIGLCVRQFLLREVVKRNYRKVHDLYEKQFYVQKSGRQLGPFTMKSALCPYCGYAKAILNLVRTYVVWKESFPVYFACTKHFFNLVKEATISVFNASSFVSCAMFL